MIKLKSTWLDLRTIDDLAAQNTFIHSLNSCTKLVTTLAFILFVTSFSNYEVTSLIPLLFYPVALMSLGNLPYKPIAKRLLLIAPFIVFIGLLNPIFDKAPIAKLGPFLITGGWLSFLSITIKLLLTVTSALILVATTGMNSICSAMAQIGVPKPIVIQILFMYRYLHVLLEEFLKTNQAYDLRSFKTTGIHYKAWGSLLGQLLLRTMDRAQRIYQAMLCRGFDGKVPLRSAASWTKKEYVYLLFCLFFFLFCRFINIPQTLGRLLTGGFQ
ncbi:cobalt ECF transporter T component CbiQ [Pelosinus propionicus]|uniref:Cobalt/nickel transport system permease protein n=1 Tax=Pelosinus propionicus DSM 13327 TaxID=1123291 RepID=A0A1I4I7Z8_9FIRM|nr:cobalt ECF transporter T component CbiQ [Pelosinus propionicus]SFL50512.1 cobalt/nickel transport system permease protein [Pelosinus propionicus DSM 13327]